MRLGSRASPEPKPLVARWPLRSLLLRLSVLSPQSPFRFIINALSVKEATIVPTLWHRRDGERCILWLTIFGPKFANRDHSEADTRALGESSGRTGVNHFDA